MAVHQADLVIERNARRTQRLGEHGDQRLIRSRGRHILALLLDHDLIRADRHFQHIVNEGDEIGHLITSERIATAGHSHQLGTDKFEIGIGIPPPVLLALPVGEIIEGVFALGTGLFDDRRRDSERGNRKNDFEHNRNLQRAEPYGPALIDIIRVKAHLPLRRFREIFFDLLARPRKISPQVVHDFLNLGRFFAKIQQQPRIKKK